MSLVTGPFLPGNSLETAVIPTSQASSFTIIIIIIIFSTGNYIWLSTVLSSIYG